MSNRPHGKHVVIDENNPSALGICDVTGFVFLRKDLVRQMEWRGDSLQWTGLYVGRPYANIPNEQNRPSVSIPDPLPVLDPRPQQPSGPKQAPGTNPPFNGSPDGTAPLIETDRVKQINGCWFTLPAGGGGGNYLSSSETFEELQNIGFISGPTNGLPGSVK